MSKSEEKVSAETDSPFQNERNQLYNLREIHLNALENCFEFIFGRILEAMPVEVLLMQKKRIRSHFDEMAKAHMLYRAITLVSSDKIYVNTEKKFIAAIFRLNRRLKELSSEEPDGFNYSSIQENSTIMGEQIIKMETIRPPQVGKFNGSPEDWPAFSDLFIAEVHSRNFDNITKLLCLRDACINEAADSLGPWQPTVNNYELAWETMNQAYNDDYHVIQYILNRMFAIQNQESGSFSSLRSVVNALRGGTRQLDVIANRSQLWDQLWIHLAKRCLPKSTLDSWEQHRKHNGATQLPKLEEFTQFLDIESKNMFTAH